MSFPRAIGFILPSLLFLSACASSRDSASSEKEAKRDPVKEGMKTIAAVEKREWQRRSSDPFDIRTVELEDDSHLKIIVRYSGGCEEHGFRMMAAPGREKSDPPRRGLFLKHDANGDACRSVIGDTLHFGLGNLDPPVVLELEGYDEPIRYGVE